MTQLLRIVIIKPSKLARVKKAIEVTLRFGDENDVFCAAARGATSALLQIRQAISPQSACELACER